MLTPTPTPRHTVSEVRWWPGHSLEVLEAGVDIEGLSDRDAGLLAEIVPPQAVERI